MAHLRSNMHYYVYEIVQCNTGKSYIGARQSKICPTDDLGVKYFSSSLDKDFIRDQKDNPSNYEYRVLREFISRQDAIDYEIELHNKFDVASNDKYINRAKQTSTGWDRTGTSHTAETKSMIADKATGRNSPMKGKELSVAWRDNLSKNHADFTGDKNPNFGNKWSSMQKMRVSEIHKNRKRVTCPHCGKEGDVSNMTRWHFNNCKEQSK